MKLNRKNKLFLLGFVLALYICYSFAIVKTINYYEKYSTQEEILNTTNNNPKLLANLISKEKQIDQWLAKNNNTSESFQNELLKKLNGYCVNYNLKIMAFNEPHIIIENGTLINSYSFAFEGSFNSVLALLNKIENNPSLGFVKHISALKKMNYKTNSENIITTIIIQKNNASK